MGIIVEFVCLGGLMLGFWISLWVPLGFVFLFGFHRSFVPNIGGCLFESDEYNRLFVISPRL